MISKKFNYLIPVLCVMLVLASCKKNDLKQVEDISNQAATQSERATNIEIIYSDSAKIKAKLTAPVMIRHLTEDPTIEMPNGEHIEFYSDSMTVTSSLRSDYGIRYINKSLTKLTGDVVVVNIQGDTLNTEELFWDEPKEMVYSQKFVKVKTPTQIILAEGFESDVAFTNYTFYKIKGIVTVEEDKAGF